MLSTDRASRWRAAHHARVTRRRQRRLDRRGMRKARRMMRVTRRRDRSARRWSAFRPYWFVTGAAVALTGAGASLGVIFGAIFGAAIGFGAGMFAGLLIAGVCLIVLEWRVRG